MAKTHLITGAAGFIGWRLAKDLMKEGHSVIAVDSLGHFGARLEHGTSQESALFKKIDRDSLFTTWSKLPKIDGVFHMGACTDTTEMDLKLLDRLNTEYSKKIWEKCTEHKIPLVYASSAATYGDGSQGYEDDESLIPRLKPLNPYGDSKQKFDLWALGEEKKGRTPPHWSGFKFFNVYGFGERHKGKMASVILHATDQIRKSGSVRLFRSHRDGIKDGEQKRDFIAVEDVVDVLFFAMSRPLERGIFNLGTGHARTYLDLANSVFQALGKPSRIDFIDTPIEIRDRYQYFTQATMDRLREAGYKKAFTPLEKGIQRYMEKMK